MTLPYILIAVIYGGVILFKVIPMLIILYKQRKEAKQKLLIAERRKHLKLLKGEKKSTFLDDFKF